LIATSAAKIPALDHSAAHSVAGDFARWGRLGGLQTLRRYGRLWFSLLGRRRWGHIDEEQLARFRAEQCVRESGAV
jgi:hypothetical protein